MTKFRVGNMVRVVAETNLVPPRFDQGTIAKVIAIEGGLYSIRVQKYGTDIEEIFREDELEAVLPELAEPTPDPVNHPSHYRLASGAEVIDITETLNFNRGNAVKYLARAGKKEGVDELEDLEKAQWYVNREVERVKAQRGSTMGSPAPDQVHVPYLDN